MAQGEREAAGREGCGCSGSSGLHCSGSSGLRQERANHASRVPNSSTQWECESRSRPQPLTPCFYPIQPSFSLQVKQTAREVNKLVMVVPGLPGLWNASRHGGPHLAGVVGRPCSCQLRVQEPWTERKQVPGKEEHRSSVVRLAQECPRRCVKGRGHCDVFSPGTQSPAGRRGRSETEVETLRESCKPGSPECISG